MKRFHYYSFLDVVVDVFYSIILYNGFVSFPGFNLNGFLLLFSVFFMLNYWWAARSFNEMPKYYLLDFYLISVVMFLFALWPAYFNDFRSFAILTAVILAFDAFYSWLDVYVHREKTDEQKMWFYFKSEILLAITYIIIAAVFPEISSTALIILFAPYLVWYFICLEKGILKTKFLDSGNEPY